MQHISTCFCSFSLICIVSWKGKEQQKEGGRGGWKRDRNKLHPCSRSCCLTFLLLSSDRDCIEQGKGQSAAQAGRKGGTYADNLPLQLLVLLFKLL